MAKYKCKRTKITTGKVCKDWKKVGRKRKCVRWQRKRVKRCADYGIRGKVRGGLYKGKKPRRRARRIR